MNPTTYDGVYAFNVKSHRLLRDERGTGQQRERAYDRAQEQWWRDAADAARGRGFTDVQSEGRSGGWLVPIPAVDPADAIHDPDGFAVAMVQLEALGEQLGRMMQTLDERFTAALDEIIAEDDFEQENERAMAFAERELRAIARDVACNDVACPLLRQRAKLALLTLGESL
jgi:alkylhydroperoxidase/carboxymuconolactone decarboxylase family protein YurZ